MKPTGDDPEKVRRFGEAAIPYIDDVYSLARHLVRDPTAADDVVQECYLRALQHFDSFGGPSIRSWLLAIVRNICRTALARRTRSSMGTIDTTRLTEHAEFLLWSEKQESPEASLLRKCDATAIRRLVDTLAEPFRETIVLREVQNLSYREISEVVGAPIGTVMSRLARARAILRAAWIAEEGHEE